MLTKWSVFQQRGHTNITQTDIYRHNITVSICPHTARTCYACFGLIYMESRDVPKLWFCATYLWKMFSPRFLVNGMTDMSKIIFFNFHPSKEPNMWDTLCRYVCLNSVISKLLLGGRDSSIGKSYASQPGFESRWGLDLGHQSCKKNIF